MTTTQEPAGRSPAPQTGGPGDPGGAGPVVGGAGSNAILFGATASLVLLLAHRFLADTRSLALSADAAWYTWRTKAILVSDPSVLFTKHGPFGMLTGGYRVTTPVIGALLNRVAGIDPNRFVVLMDVGVPVLASLGLAAFAYRHRRDPIIFLLTLVASVALFLTIPFIGYLDDITCLAILAVALPFLEPARTSWGARSALALLMFLAILTHPTTTAIFALVLGLAVAVRLVMNRFRILRTWREEGPMVLSVGAGLAVGSAWWILGLWGSKAPFGEAVLTQPYPSSFFRTRLNGWVQSMHPAFTIPLALVAIAWVLWMVVRGREEGTDWHSRISVLWLLPIVGVFGWLVGKTYPYYRFLNPTLAAMLLVGLGLWVVTLGFARLGRRLGDRRGLLQWLAAAGLIVFLAVFYYQPGLRMWNHQTPWIDAPTRVDAATARAYAEAQPHAPVVFLLHPDPQNSRDWGLSKISMNVILGGLSGPLVGRSFFVVGTADDFLAGHATVTGQPLFDRLSRGFLADAKAGVAPFDHPPIVFLIRSFNDGAPPSQARSVELSPDVLLVQGPGVAGVAPGAQTAARAVTATERASLARSDPLLGDVGHLARAALGLLPLLVLPGLIARRWFEVDDFPSALALVPGMSLAMVVASGILVVTIHRAPFGAADGWASLALALAASVVLAALARRRDAAATRPAGTGAGSAVGAAAG